MAHHKNRFPDYIYTAPPRVNQALLYSHWLSPCCWRVRIALHLKNINYDVIPIDLHLFSEQYTNEYRNYNPMSQVPTLTIDGYNIIESLAIMNYLDETRLYSPLLPTDAYLRCRVRQICDIICSGVQPLNSLRILYHVDKQLKKAWFQLWFKRGFSAIEKLLSVQTGKYCVGDEITMADCCLFPEVYNARRLNQDLLPYPIIMRVVRALEIHPAFKDTHPFYQPDCPPLTILNH